MAIFSALLSFLGGSVFRMVWGEVSAWINKKLEHQHEMERLEAQERYSAAQHARNLEAIRLQAEQQVKVIEVQAQAAVGEIEAGAWLEAVRATAKQTGVKWVDAWNAVIRPGVATWGVAMLTLEALGWLALVGGGAEIADGTKQVIYAALGIFLADRTLAKRGK